MPLFRSLLVSALFLAAFSPALAQAQAPVAPTKTLSVDPRAMALLALVDSKMYGLKSYSADFTWIDPPDKVRGDTTVGRITGSVRLMKPNFALAKGWEEEDDPATGARGKAILGQVFSSNGKMYYHWWHDGEISTKPADPSGGNVRVGFLLGVNSFFAPGNSLVKEADAEERDDQDYTMSLAAPVTVDGVPCRVVDIATTSTSSDSLSHDSETLSIGPDLLVHRFVWDLNGARGESKITVDITHITINRSMAASSFAFSPPKTAQAVLPPGGLTPPTPSLLAAGTQAPDFTVQDAAGHAVKLSDYKGKTIVLDFWATWCDPCQASLPHTNQVAKQFKDKGVVVLALNVWDTSDAFRYWLPRHKSYDSLVFAVDTRDYGRYVTSLYKIGGIPTQYVIDPEGKVVATIVGYDKPTDDLADAIQKAAGAS